jgi:spore coat polysaccharide biosynthesis predicted glycosyltransferase SpsG
MKVVLRADASKTTGAGHVMRSLPIINELIKRDFDCIFVGNVEEIFWLKTIVKETGFSQIYKSETEYPFDFGQDIIIIDSYSLPLQHEFIQREKWKHVVAIVDSFSPHYMCSLRVQIGVDNKIISNDGTPTLFGPSFIPFRNFTKPKVGNNQILQVVVSGGSSNPNFFAEHICEELKRYELDFTCLIYAPFLTDISLDRRFHVIRDGKLYDENTSKADVVFCTASYSSLEFLAQGKAIGVSCAVPNQKNYYFELSNMGLSTQISCFQGGVWITHQKNMSRLLSSEKFRNYFRRNANKLIDLDGSKRIADAIVHLH